MQAAGNCEIFLYQSVSQSVQPISNNPASLSLIAKERRGEEREGESGEIQSRAEQSRDRTKQQGMS